MSEAKRVRTPPARGGKGGHEPRARIRVREQRVLDLVEQGLSQQQIATALDISQPAVSKILSRLAEQWRHGRQKQVDQYRLVFERRYGRLYRFALEGFERSQRDRTRKRQRKSEGAKSQMIAEVIVDESHGNPAYLEQARRALESLDRILGVTRATMDEPANNGTASEPISTQDLVQIMAEKLDNMARQSKLKQVGSGTTIEQARLTSGDAEAHHTTLPAKSDGEPSKG